MINKRYLSPGIVVYSDVVNNHDKVLYNLKEASSNQSIMPWKSSKIIKNGEGVVDDTYRKVEVLSIPLDFCKNIILDIKNISDIFKNQLGNLLYISFDPLITDYKKDFNIHDDGTLLEGSQESYQLLRYGKNNFFNCHFDDSAKYHRKISLVYYFNEDYSGGEIEFDKFGIRYKPKANELIIFPSTYVYSHSVQEVTEGTRYSLVTWLK